ncbi:oxidoreductase [Bordetella ansorpii]|uniref:Oxidoreductase n=1 Tax=Bordetella ansorpii TaxID=288768 RepID=A0A157SVY0_9BORD|nr:oxidoreductase [Bordetella ansorpii]
MKYHRLGNTGLFVSELAFGAMTFGNNAGYESLGGLGQGEANAMVRRAFDAGINLYDTADFYALGESERLLGEALRNLGEARENYLIATKVFGPMTSGPNGAGASRAHILDAAKGSLRRLGVDHIDLYQVHGFDPATPIEETLRALDDLVRQGHVRYVGVSNFAAWHLARALGIADRLNLTRPSSLQAYYSVVGRDLEREIAPLLDCEGVGLLVWSPLAGGFLSGKQARGESVPEGSRDLNARPHIDYERGFDVIDALRPIAESYNASVAQISLAWLLHQKVVTSVLAGAKRMDQLEDNLKAADIVLSTEALEAVGAVSHPPRSRAIAPSLARGRATSGSRYDDPPKTPRATQPARTLTPNRSAARPGGSIYAPGSRSRRATALPRRWISPAACTRPRSAPSAPSDKTGA